MGRLISKGMNIDGPRGRFTASKLAAELVRMGHYAVTEDQVNNWKQGTVKVPEALMQPVAMLLGLKDEQTDQVVCDAVGYDPLLMVRLAGLEPIDSSGAPLRLSLSQQSLDADVVSRLKTRETLDHRILEQQAQLASVERDYAARTLVQAVLESRRYGMALWPVLAAPTENEDHQLHVSDRVDLRRLDGRVVDEDSVWSDLGPSLMQARGWPSVAEPRWPSESQTLLIPDPHLSRWNLRRLDIPRPAMVPRAHAGFPAIAFSATVSSSWVGNLASLVGMVLGYGTSSTTDMARQIGPDSRFTPSTQTRAMIHNELLKDPGERFVWAHAAKFDPKYSPAPWHPISGATHPNLIHVRLVEDDELLDATAADRGANSIFVPSDLRDWKASRDRAVETAPDNERTLLIRVQHVEFASTQKWAHTFERAHHVLCHLEGLGLMPWAGLEAAQAKWIEHADGITKPALTWFREHGTPFVFAPKSVGASASPKAHVMRHSVTMQAEDEPLLRF